MTGDRRRCQHCGGSNPAHGRFCERCGEQLPESCPACGFELVANARFCGGCGLHLETPEAEPRALPDAAVAGRSSGGRVLGEHKWVTVLFADIRGSLGLIERLDPESACDMLDGAIEIMIDAVGHHRGTVNRVMGDGVMAVFGAPRAQENHAVHACHAALAILAQVEGHAAAIRSRLGLDLDIRIGISSGPVMVRTIRGVSIPYDVIGTTAHLASRMEKLAASGTVWLAAETARLVAGFFDLRPLGAVSVRGISAPVEVFELTRGLPVGDAFDLALARGLSPFVGREREMEDLSLSLRRAEAGHGQLIAIVGEAGIGKSRLTHQFLERASRRKLTLLKTAPSGYGMAAPWQKLAGLLRCLLELEPGDDGRHVRRRLRHELEAIEPALLAHETPLLASLDLVPDDDRVWRELEPRLRRDRIQKAYLALFECLSRHQLVAIVVEDLHESDAQTIEALQLLGRQLGDWRLLLLVTYRQYFRHGWPADLAYRQLRLGPLPAADVRRLLDDRLGPEGALDPVKAQVEARAGGNPFFIEEMILQLADAGLFTEPAKGLGEPSRLVPEDLLPPTVQAVIEARIDRLAFEDKRLLRIAAVIGETVELGLLHAVADQDRQTVDDGVARLCELEFLQPSGTGTWAALRFRHALFVEVAQRMLPGWQRRAIHQRIVETLDPGHGEISNERLAALVDHALSAGLWERAARFAIDLAQRAIRQSASFDAIAACEKAERALGYVDEESGARLELTLQLRFAQIEAYFSAGNHARVAAEVDEALALASRLDDQGLVVKALSYKAFRSWLQGDMDEAVAAGQHARRVAAGTGQLDAEINTAYRQGAYLLARGDYRGSVAAFEDALELMPADRLGDRFGVMLVVSAAARSICARALAELLEFERARRLAEESIALARRFDHPLTFLYVAQEVGLVHLRACNFNKAIPILTEGYEVAQQLPTNLLRPAVTSELGLALVEAGRIAEGLELLEEAHACARSLNLVPQFGQQLGHLARGRLARGEVGEAGLLAREALGLTRRHHERGDEAWILFLLAEISESQSPRQAPSAFREVIELAVARGLLTLEQHARRRLRSSTRHVLLIEDEDEWSRPAHRSPSRTSTMGGCREFKPIAGPEPADGYHRSRHRE